MKASLTKWHKGGLKNPLSRARNLGSAHEGLHHWMAQRISAILLIPLIYWLCWSVIGLVHADQAAFVMWLAKPWNTILMIMTIITMFYHAALGCQVIVEDYIHTEWFKLAKLVSMKIVLFTTCLACIYAVLKVAL
jgi:succinate dehydrogenase / fumarate reductase membrane anchor subunit